MEKQRDYKKVMIELLEEVSKNGMEGAIPTLIAEGLVETKYKHNSMADIVRSTSEHISKSLETFEITLTSAKRLLHSNIYSVVEENGVKQLKIEGYYYDEDGIKYVEFLHFYHSLPATTEKIVVVEHAIEQRIDDLTEEGFFYEYRDILRFYPHLPVENVNKNTPCGTYIDMF